MSVSIKFDGQAQGAVRATKQLKKSFQETVDEYEAGMQVSRRQATQNRKAVQLARQLTRSTETLTSKVRLLREGLRNNAITQDEYNRATQRLREQNRGVIFSMASIRKEIGKIDLGALVTKYLSWSAAVAAVTTAVGRLQSALQEQRQAELEAGQAALQSTLRTGGQLAQLTTDYEELIKLQKEANRGFRLGLDRDVANRLQFSLTSAGFDPNERRLLQGIAASGLVDVGRLPELIRGLRGAIRAFGGEETGDFVETLSTLSTAAATASTDLEALTQQVNIAGTGAQRLGLGEEETASALAALADQLGGVKRAGTDLTQLFNQLARRLDEGIIEPIDRNDFVKTLETLKKQAEDAGITLQTYLGGDTAIRALLALIKVQDEYREILDQVNAANRDTILKQVRNAEDMTKLARAIAQARNFLDDSRAVPGRQGAAQGAIGDFAAGLSRRIPVFNQLPEFVPRAATDLLTTPLRWADAIFTQTAQQFDDRVPTLLQMIVGNTAQSGTEGVDVNKPETNQQ